MALSLKSTVLLRKLLKKVVKLIDRKESGWQGGWGRGPVFDDNLAGFGWETEI